MDSGISYIVKEIRSIAGNIYLRNTGCKEKNVFLKPNVRNRHGTRRNDIGRGIDGQRYPWPSLTFGLDDAERLCPNLLNRHGDEIYSQGMACQVLLCDESVGFRENRSRHNRNFWVQVVLATATILTLPLHIGYS
jgi:hypothetical protein